MQQSGYWILFCRGSRHNSSTTLTGRTTGSTHADFELIKKKREDEVRRFCIRVLGWTLSRIIAAAVQTAQFL